MYRAGYVEVKYLDMVYKTDYLDWYKQAVRDGKNATPTWVIDINEELESDIKDNNTFYPVYAATMTFTSYFMTPNASLNPLETLSNMKTDENVMMKPILVVVPHGSCLATLSEYQRNQTRVPITIKKFMNCDSILMPHSQYEFKNAVINHVELINGDEIAIIFTCYSIKITEKIWKNDGTSAGQKVKSIDYSPTTSGLAQEGTSVIKNAV